VDGGTPVQCNGKFNVAYPGTGVGKDCAWNSPMAALPSGGAPRIAGGDMLVIHPGQFKIGLGAPSGAEGCSASWPWECVMAAIPSGPDAAHPTRIVGEGHDTGCVTRPQLWGTQRVSNVVNMKSSNNVRMACLELTDHEACAYGHQDKNNPTLACQRGTAYPTTDARYPFGYYADRGIYAVDSSNVQLTDLNIHGFAHDGVWAGRLTDWTLTRVRLANNAWVGWDGDLGQGVNSSNKGTIKFSSVTVEWNGCVETYGSGTPGPVGCFGQSAGGYGDGVGVGRTGGNWVIENSSFLHNVSDGLDLLYADGTGSIVVNHVRSEGNAGNQLKVSGPSLIQNSVVVGNCGYFGGKTFTYNVDNCRAAGDTVAMAAVNATDVMTMVNTTVISEGNVIVLGSGPTGSKLRLTNNILIGRPYFIDTGRNAGDVYWETGIAVTEQSNTKQNLHNWNCSRPGVSCVTSGVVVNDTLNAFNAALLSTSPARGTGALVTGLAGYDNTDLNGVVRPTSTAVDRGAVQFR